MFAHKMHLGRSFPTDNRCSSSPPNEETSPPEDYQFRGISVNNGVTAIRSDVTKDENRSVRHVRFRERPCSRDHANVVSEDYVYVKHDHRVRSWKLTTPSLVSEGENLFFGVTEAAQADAKGRTVGFDRLGNCSVGFSPSECSGLWQDTRLANAGPNSIVIVTVNLNEQMLEVDFVDHNGHVFKYKNALEDWRFARLCVVSWFPGNEVKLLWVE